MTRESLRVATPDDAPRPKLTLVEATELGDERAMLTAMASRIAKEVQSESTSTRDLASLSKRLMEIEREIKALDIEEQEAGGAEHGSVDTSFDASAV